MPLYLAEMIPISMYRVDIVKSRGRGDIEATMRVKMKKCLYITRDKILLSLSYFPVQFCKSQRGRHTGKLFVFLKVTIPTQMARSSLNLDNYNDVVVRDIAYRNQYQMAPSANIIRNTYSHVSGNTANVSAAEVVSVDGSNQGQWDLLLGTSARRLNANSITTANTATWSANSMISVRSATTTIRSANVVVGNLTVTGTLTSTNSSITSVGTLTSLYVTGNVGIGIGKSSPAFALDVAGTTRSDIITTGTISALGNGLSLQGGQILDTTALTQGSVLGWNSEGGSGRTDIVNKSGTGSGGFNFYNSTGSGSAFSTGRNLLAQMTPISMLIPNDLFCANSVSTTSNTAGYRLYYRQLAQPCVWTSTYVVTPSNSAGFSIDVVLTNPPFCQSSHTTIVSACNGDPAANVEFIVLGAYLFNTSGTFPNNSAPQKVRLWCRCVNTNDARVNVQIIFYPI